MHILLALAAAAATIGVVLWRLHMAAEAAKGLAETAQEAHSLLRRWRWRRKLRSDPIADIEDPREAAAAMMVVLAQGDGAITERERQAILGEMTTRFEASEDQAEELFARARWLVRDVHDVDEGLRKLAPVIRRRCDAGQINDVLTMLRTVSKAEAVPGVVESDALERVRRLLKS